MASDPRKTVIRLVALVAVMGGLSFAAVPFYDWFCRVTGYGGEPAVADGRDHQILDRTIKIRFDANTEPGMPWEFRPAVREVELRIGETGLAFYTAHNPTDRVVAGTASYNVAPFSAGGYFTKIDCFCFTEQQLQPGETVEMPVTFYVDPEIVEDREARHVTTITLSYTFYETELPVTDQTAAELTDARTGANESGTVGLN
jgi:cytochrome c oxidase assembly protein subunit 11